jgi:predicted Zn-dependent protease
MDIGAYVGARSYSQSYELEADTLGAFIAARAGYDPERGAQIFLRPALANPGGPPILASHPGSAQRQATVAGVAAEIRRQQSLGLDPRPGQAG